MGRKSRFTSKALDYAFDRYIGTARERVESFEEELVSTPSWPEKSTIFGSRRALPKKNLPRWLERPLR